MPLKLKKMGATKLQYLTDDKGQKIAVVLSVEEYDELVNLVDELEDIQVFDEYKKNPEDTIPLRQAIQERKRNA